MAKGGWSERQYEQAKRSMAEWPEMLRMAAGLSDPHWGVLPYITEEVKRQGHDIHALDGISRVGWMIEAWCYALHCANVLKKKPEYKDAVELGKRVEQVKNSNGVRGVGVRVGQRVCPAPQDVDWMLQRLFTQRDDMEPLEFYRQFEEVHPFVDGNGRTGKILLNWLNGTLLNPIFPPADFWGKPIRNP